MQSYFVAILVALVALGSARRLERDDLFAAFRVRHNKAYTAEEMVWRRAIWESNLDYVERHNVEADRGMHSYWMGENQFTDLTNSEFVNMKNGYTMSNKMESNVQYVATSRDVPDSVDWRTKGYVTDIKNQEQCGSCWAFSTTGSLEGQHFKKNGTLTSLSEQNLVDCSKKEGNKGCEGGLMDNGFKYIIENKGIDTEVSYPYKAKNGRCEFKAANIGATVASFVDVKRGSEEALAQAVADIGPISVAMDASHISFQHYRTGIYKEPRCSSIRLDHGVLAVGYGAESSVESSADGNYWIVKNSWGTSWGDKGYFKIAKDDKNMCGLATQASYPVV